MVNILVHELNNAGKSSLLAECSRWEVAQRLKTPNKIAGFVQLLNPEKESGDEERSRLLQERTVDNLISLVVNQTNKETLQNWYNTSLTPREQLLALGLSFFNGMFEDQFFAALEEIVEGVWQKRDVSLRALDYCDLDNLRYYFDYFPLKAYGSKLNGFTFVKTKDEATEIEISRIDIRILKKIAQQHADLNEAIARSLARAYRNKPEEVVNTLDLWSKECVQNLLKPINTTRLTERDSLLATVALTYGEIQCSEGIGMLTAEEVFRRLSKILTGERYFFVRRAVLTAICNQARQRFDRIEGQLQDLIPNVTDSECNNIVETITEIYLKQRENLEGGDDIVEVNKRRYQVWFESSKRPKTVVEEAMIRWVKDETKAVSQQVAMQALVNFARVLDLEEESSLKKLQQEKRGRTQPEIYTLESFDNFVTIGETQIGFYFAQLVSWLATLKAKHYQAVIRNIMPEVMKQHNSRREVMSFVLNRWSRLTDNEIRTISGLLKYGLLLAENFGAIVLAMGTLLTLTGIAVVNISQNLPVSTSPSSPNSSVVLTPSSSATPAITQQEAINLVYTWLQAKPRIFAPPFDRQLVADLTTDERYTKTIAAIEGLQKDNAYYKYGPSEVEATGEFFSPESNQIIIGVKVTEDYTYYVNDQVVPSESKSGTQVYRLLFKLEDGRWKIAKTIR